MMSSQPHHDHFDLESVSACPGCSSPNLRSAYAPDISRCGQCRLYFRNPRPTQESIRRSYENGLTFDRWQQELETRSILWQKRLDLVLRHQTEGRLADIGTGDGFFLNLTTRHFDTTATEVAAAGVAHAARHGHQVLLGGAEVLTDGSDRFDVVTLWHVLEHVPQPAQLLRDLRGIVAPSGILALAVPNESAALLSAKLRAQLPPRNRSTADDAHPFGPLTFGEEIHLTHFTPSVLKKLLKRSGFRMVEFGVDDVHVNRSRSATRKYQANRLLNAVTRTHFDNAMYLVCVSGE